MKKWSRISLITLLSLALLTACAGITPEGSSAKDQETGKLVAVMMEADATYNVEGEEVEGKWFFSRETLLDKEQTATDLSWYFDEPVKTPEEEDILYHVMGPGDFATKNAEGQDTSMPEPYEGDDWMGKLNCDYKDILSMTEFETMLENLRVRHLIESAASGYDVSIKAGLNEGWVRGRIYKCEFDIE